MERTTLQPSNSEESKSFYLLDRKIQQWIWNQGWTDLRDAQEKAIPAILSGNSDVIIASATASGKTEAAFLPICSRLLKDECRDASVLYLSPLKALINDQFYRMEQLCEQLDIQVHPWHGDISASIKRKFLCNSAGILLITPESMESLFANHGTVIPKLFGRLSYIVIDELHSFIGSERGQQLQSLMRRLEFVLKRKIPRIGLSATIGDINLAAQFLRGDKEDDIEVIVSQSTGQELQLLLRGYVRKTPVMYYEGNDQNDVQTDGSIFDIGKNLFDTLRGNSNLIFANSRNRVEVFADMLRRMCEEQRLPNEFWPHHGSLAKELREDAETAIKDKTRPVSIVCTSTLELGIDIGSVNSIAQIGIPPSVAGMRQRLGRSGRRGSPAILRIYVSEEELTEFSCLSDCLRAGLVQTIAMVRLLLAKWYEPPAYTGLHLSTLTQQVLSLIAQYGGVTASQAYNVLCGSGGPFNQVNHRMFSDFLRCLGSNQLIIQNSDGFLLHGERGERIVNHYSFYTAFMTPEEYRLIAGDQILGSLPIDRPVTVDSFLIFGGKRWIVADVDDKKKIILLKPSKGGKAPVFNGQAGWVHDRIRQEMFAVYTEKSMPIFLDAKAKELLLEARENFYRYGLAEKRIVPQGNCTHIFCWTGDRVMDTLVAMLHSKGLKAANEGISVSVFNTMPSDVIDCLKALSADGLPDTLVLSEFVKNKICEKYDSFLNDELLCNNYAASKLDAKGAFNALRSVLAYKG
jgi:ATP-dependent Lhr-like helicase